MLTTAVIEQILERIPRLTVGVIGDLFLDRYLDIDAALTEPSIETGLDAYQVARVRCYPGAAGTVINNLAALGVKRVCPIAIIGDDGEGWELRQALDELDGVETKWVSLWDKKTFRTPTYTKPMLHQPGQPPRELNRLDIKNRSPLRPAAEELLLKSLAEVWPQVNALIVLDQVSEVECGVITTRVRDRIAELGKANPDKLILADSRERIGQFRFMSLKPNDLECRTAVYGPAAEPHVHQMAANELARRSRRPVFCSRGAGGIMLVDPARTGTTSDWCEPVWVPAYPVIGPIDIVGAGDSASAGIACAVAAGATLEQAAAFGNLVASITIQQIGVTGTATPEQVRQRWGEVSRQ